MVFCPVIISSPKPFSRPRLADLARNRGLVFPVRNRVIQADRGTVTANTSTSRGEIIIIMYKEPATVIAVVIICTRSLDRDSLTVSIS